jgi:hypothetical protein
MEQIILEGGPEGLPRSIGVSPHDLHEGRIKVAHRNGYEHFERVDEAGSAGSTFRWAMRTRIAE